MSMFRSHSDAEALMATFHDSFDRCKANPAFFQIFYENFLSMSDEIRAMFSGTDMERLQRKLRDSFYLVMMASSGLEVARQRFLKLGILHKSRGAQADQVHLWLSALIETVSQIDPLFSAEVEESWRAIMSTGVEIMKSELERAS